MSREIKFRAWNTEAKYIVQDPTSMGSVMRDHVRKALDLNRKLIGENYEVMQFTGRKDINGVEIYESDLVKYGKKTLEVIWNPIGSGSWWYAEPGRIHVRRIDLDELEVIGNIYENPELLGTRP